MRTPSANSRYQSAPVLTLPDGNRVYNTIFARPNLKVVGERLHIVTEPEELRPDLIAHRSLGDPAAWWVIMEYNKIVDPMTLKRGDNLRIPLYSLTPANLVKPLGDVVETLGEASSPPPQLPPVKDDVTTESPDVYRGVYNFRIEPCLTGRVHYEIQVALDQEFSILLLGSLSAISPDRWFWMGANGYRKWPASGLDGISSGGLSAFFTFLDSDPVLKGGTYYARLRNVTDNKGKLTYGPWFGSVFGL